MNIAIIPARKGSKRIKNKNIKIFFKRPIISYSIEAAKKSKIFDMIIVSTDSKKFASIARRCGAKAPFIRPKKYSGDYTDTQSVIVHAIKFLQKNYFKKINYICCIYPANPLISRKNILHGYRLVKKNKSKYIFPVTTFKYPIMKSFFVNKKNNLKMIFKKFDGKRTQDVPQDYHDTGQFYWAHYKTWLNKKFRFNNNCSVFEIPRSRNIDIDTMEDWNEAEMKYYFTRKKK